ncbi:acyl-CoA synthetase [Pseudolysinimonas yzui]|uniref:Fatty-acyl-CoA synthase n=1 Tax=Pseudolysinimonas yzui TaxID=2708254 RepID=A0A8J3GR66_9MICO|nr:long-chain fatty acid--CoA ligase [Pseudolysinimonas yzui]GHF19260.1 fatty-acyl-CoA synthase [Pseudolysinimonas yzui]
MQNRGIGSWLTTRAATSGDVVALVHGDGEQVTYRELADRAARWAAVLTARGIGRGERIAFLGENQPAFVEVLFGAARVGVVFVPVNTRLAAPEVAYILADSGARLLVHDDRSSAVATEAAGDLPRIVVGADADAALAAVEPAPETPGVGLDDPAAILYTSGTTGRPKGAVLTHGNLTWNALNTIIDADIVSTDVALVISPLFHAASLGMGLLPVLLKGATVVLERAFDAGRALRLIEEHGVTMLSGVPTTYQFMAEHPDWASTDLSTLGKLTCGGSPVPTRVLEAFEARGLSFSQGYGMTETSPGATYLPATRTRAKMGSAGQAHFFTEVRVVGENGEVLEPGEIGEIQVRGPNVTPGYHGNPAATAEAFTPDGWFRTGDLGSFDDEGFLFVADRLKDMIISGGENIYPAEVEDLILGLDEVTGAAVIGIPDERWGETPWAVVTLREGAELTTERLAEHLNGRIARYKIPKNVVVVDELPRTASGKVKKLDLRNRFS